MLPRNNLLIGIHLSCENQSASDGQVLPLELVLSATLRSITLGGIELVAEDVDEDTRSTDLDADGVTTDLGRGDENAGQLSHLELELLRESPARIESTLRSAEYRIRYLPARLQAKARKMVRNVHRECENRRAIITRIEDLVREAYRSDSEEMVEDAWVQLVTAMEHWPPAWKQLGRDAFEEACKLGYDEREQRQKEDPLI